MRGNHGQTPDAGMIRGTGRGWRVRAQPRAVPARGATAKNGGDRGGRDGTSVAPSSGMREISSASFSNRLPSPFATVLAALACAWAPGCGGGDTTGNEAPRSTCSTEVDCAEGLVCDPARRVCVECAADGDCGEDEVCDANRCAPDPSCQSDEDCAPNVCDLDSERCVACVEDEHCDN